MDTGKGEHYVTARGTSDFMAALKNASTYLRLDSKIFLIIVKNGLLTTHEVYGKSAQPTKVPVVLKYSKCKFRKKNVDAYAFKSLTFLGPPLHSTGLHLALH